MIKLAGWDGPVPLTEGAYRYSKTASWKRLYIEISDRDLLGGLTGGRESFEVALEEGIWKRYPTDLSETPEGHVRMRLREFCSLDVVLERVGEGVPLEEEISCIEDLAAYLERYVEPSPLTCDLNSAI
jgi:hypothetical protein